VVAVSGSSQRMMQGLVLSDDAPLCGRARELLELQPLEPGFLQPALHPQGSIELVEHYTAWGGVPRYWELARTLRGSPRARIDQLVLDPLGPLHREPDRLLLEEVPSALEVRPMLDAIGAGAHKVSEIAGRIGFSATSMSRPLDRLIGLGLVRREVPFGESEKISRRSLYKIDDPFFRLWFRVVAPHRAQLAAGVRRSREQLLGRFWNGLAASAWEDFCRRRIPKASSSTDLGKRGPWGPASRWWKGATLEWDLLSESADGKRLLLGEVKWSRRPFGGRALERAVRALVAKPLPDLPKRFSERKPVRTLFVPEVRSDYRSAGSAVLIVTASSLIR
jgi:AAA+ ATPase superfamily predicted ATPase